MHPSIHGKLISTSQIYAENEFAGDRNAWATRDASLGCWQYFVLSATIRRTRIVSEHYCRGRFLFFEGSRNIEKH